ncbi:MAG: septum formation initiator family protein [candidate division WOR-3 bacterium]|nr:septum formation initiator family protein [candidate division WOR-3 bacterium]
MIFLILPGLYLGRKIFFLLNAYHTERSLTRDILILKAENEMLEKRIAEYKRGTLIETRARNELGMIKKNEKIFLIIK